MTGKGAFVLMFVMAMALFASHAFAVLPDQMGANCLMKCNDHCGMDTKCLDDCGMSCISAHGFYACKSACSIYQCAHIAVSEDERMKCVDSCAKVHCQDKGF